MFWFSDAKVKGYFLQEQEKENSSFHRLVCLIYFTQDFVSLKLYIYKM